MVEINMKIAISFVIMIIMLRWAWKFLNWVWINPKKLEKRLKTEGLKGSSYKFLLGDMKEMNTMLKEANSKPINFTNDYFSRSFPLYTKLMKQYGKNCYMWLGPKPAIFITEPELIREVLSKSNIYLKIKGNPIAKLLAKGLASYEADKWAKHRRIINPAFHLDKLKHMLPSFYLSSCDMIKEWDNIVSSEGSSEVDVWPFLQTLTSDAISRTAFGSNSEEGRQIFELQKEQVYLSLQATRWIYIPGWRFVPTKRNKRIQQITNEVRSLVLGIINKRIREMKEGEATKNDLLGILLESNFNEIQKHGHKNFGMTIDDVIEECKLFYLAGQETTSVLLVWTLILLSKHLDWQEKARQEVHQVFGSNKPTYDLLNQLKVVTMILNEVLRLYPPGILLVRRLEKETKLGNLSLPGGILLVLPKLLLQHDNELWGDDAKEFNPQRFSEGVNKATKGKFSYFPFSWGPRICIGLNFAMLEAKMALSMILQHYSFELSPSYAHAPCTIITLIPQHGAPLILRKLSKVKSVSDC